MGKRRNALGRGLEALIPASTSAAREVRLDDIEPGLSQPRKRFDEGTLEELAGSMRTYGVLQPLIVSEADESGKRTLIAGERRWQAARIAGLETVPVVERSGSLSNAMEIALVENIQRQDLDPLEEAAAFDRLVREFGLTQEDLALRVGRSRSSVANTLRLLSLPTPARQALIQGDITEGHARTLLRLELQAAEMVLERIVREGLNVRQTERLVSSMVDGPSKPPGTIRVQRPELRELEERLRSSLGTKVSVVKGRKFGRIVIEYYSNEDLETLVERLLNQPSFD